MSGERYTSARVQEVLASVCASLVGHKPDAVVEIRMDVEELTVTSLTKFGRRTDSARWSDLDEWFTAEEKEQA